MVEFKLPVEQAENYKIGQTIPVVIDGMETFRIITRMEVSRFGVKIIACEPRQRTYRTSEIHV